MKEIIAWNVKLAINYKIMDKIVFAHQDYSKKRKMEHRFVFKKK